MIIVRYGEIAIKRGKGREFERKLAEIIAKVPGVVSVSRRGS